MCLKFAFLSEGYRLYIYVTFTHHLSPCNSMVRASHWSSEGYRLYTYVTFTKFTSHLSPCTFSSMVRASHWSSESYRLYTYVLKIMYSQWCIISDSIQNKFEKVTKTMLPKQCSQTFPNISSITLSPPKTLTLSKCPYP